MDKFDKVYSDNNYQHLEEVKWNGFLVKRHKKFPHLLVKNFLQFIHAQPHSPSRRQNTTIKNIIIKDLFAYDQPADAFEIDILFGLSIHSEKNSRCYTKPARTWLKRRIYDGTLYI